MERWIKGYEGKYSCNRIGKIFRHYKTRQPREISGYEHGNCFVVKLTRNGASKEFIKSRLIYETLIAPIPSGMIVARKNGILNDSHIDNLILTNKKKHGVKTGPKSRSKPVELLNEDGEVIDSWSSARKAAKDLFMSYQTVMDICNKKVKKKLANLRWEKV